MRQRGVWAAAQQTAARPNLAIIVLAVVGCGMKRSLSIIVDSVHVSAMADEKLQGGGGGERGWHCEPESVEQNGTDKLDPTAGMAVFSDWLTAQCSGVIPLSSLRFTEMPALSTATTASVLMPSRTCRDRAGTAQG